MAAVAPLMVRQAHHERVNRTALGQVFLERRIDTLVDDEHLNLFRFANSEDQFRAKAQQAVFVGDNQATDAPFDDFIE